MLTEHFASIVGFSLIGIALVAVFISPYRHWLGFTVAGVVFWSVVEALRLGVSFCFECSIISSYLVSVVLSLGLMTAFLLCLDQINQNASAQRQAIEHTPVCHSKK